MMFGKGFWQRNPGSATAFHRIQAAWCPEKEFLHSHSAFHHESALQMVNYCSSWPELQVAHLLLEAAAAARSAAPTEVEEAEEAAP